MDQPAATVTTEVAAELTAFGSQAREETYVVSMLVRQVKGRKSNAYAEGGGGLMSTFGAMADVDSQRGSRGCCEPDETALTATFHADI